MGVRSAPKVSVIAISYNHERFVVECLESIRAQTYQAFELIVCDDASTDGTVALQDAWIAQHRPDAKVVRHARNQGICRMLNDALAVATGEFITIIGTDDTWTSDMIERLLSRIEREPPQVAMVYSNSALMDVNGAPLPGLFIHKYWPNLQPPSGDILNVLAVRNFIPAMAIIVRSSALRAVGGFDEELVYEDYDMWLRLAVRYHIVFDDAVVARYRIVPGSITHRFLLRPGPPALVTDCRMAIKLLRSGRLSKEMEARWRNVLSDGSYGLYEHDDPRASRYLRASAMHSRSLRWALLSLTAASGLTLSRLRRLGSVFRVRS